MHWKQYSIEPMIQITALHTLFFRHFQKGYDFAGETHGFWECVYIARGNVCVTADERVMLLSEGDIVFHKPFELHKFSVESAGGADLLIFSFTASGALEKSMQNKVLLLDEFQKGIAENMLTYLQKTYREKRGDSSKPQMISSASLFQTVAGYPQMMQCYITQLILSIADASSRYEVSTAADADLFSKAVAFMNSNVDATLSVSDIARWTGSSASGLKRVFGKYAKMGVHRYFLLLKIQAATKLLQEGKSVAETAERLGFSSQAYFSTCYKRETGQNPSISKNM